jgi:hypothetical protein
MFGPVVPRFSTELFRGSGDGFHRINFSSTAAAGGTEKICTEMEGLVGVHNSIHKNMLSFVQSSLLKVLA